VLSGGPHAAVAATAAEQAALLPPTLEESYLLRNGDTVTGLVMIFSKPLDPATAQDTKNYQLQPSVAVAANNAISAAVYNPSQDSVTLMLAQPFTLKPTASLLDVFMVDVTPGSTITDTSGHTLVSGFDEYPGMLLADFVSQGPQPNPLFHTYVQSRINKELAPMARAASTQAANAANPIHLTGTIHGTYSPVALWGTMEGGFSVRSTETVTKGAGSISPLGQVTDWVTVSPFFDLKIQGRSFQNQGRTFQTKQGKVFLRFDLQWAGTSSLEGEYTITGGTGAYAGETGSGHVQITWTGSNSRGKVTEIYS